MTNELQFLRACDELCAGDVLLGSDRDAKVKNYLSLASMITTRIQELESAFNEKYNETKNELSTNGD